VWRKEGQEGRAVHLAAGIAAYPVREERSQGVEDDEMWCWCVCVVFSCPKP